MKNIIFLFTAIFLVIATSCHKEDIGGDDTAGIDANGRKLVSITINDASQTEYKVKSVNDGKIYNMTIMVFDSHGVLFARKFGDWTTAAASQVMSEIPIEAGCRIYAVANIGHNTPSNAKYYRKYFNAIIEESDLLSCITSYDTYGLDNPIVNTTAASEMIMTGKSDILVGDETSLTISLERILAQVTCSATITANAATANMIIMGVRFSSISNSSYLFRKDTDILMGDEDFFTSDWYTPAATGKSSGTKTVYLFENRQGTGKDKSVITDYSDVPSNSSFFEILINNNGELYTYRVYLGKNATTDYNIERNNRYTINVTISGVTNITTDYRVENVSTLWYVENNLLLHYDGIFNNGRNAQRVTNSSARLLDPNLPESLNTFNEDNFYYNYDKSYPDYPNGYTAPDLTASGYKNRWKNIATDPRTAGNYNLPLYKYTSGTDLTLPNAPDFGSTLSWYPDCLNFNGGYGSFEYKDNVLNPEEFTVEVVFSATSGNTNGGGNDLFAFMHGYWGPRYVIIDMEVYRGGLGFIAGGNWSGMNFITSDLVNYKRRAVIQYDGHSLYAWYGKRMIYSEPKIAPGDLPWNKGEVGARGPGKGEPLASQLTIGLWGKQTIAGEAFKGRVYAFRFYDRMLTKAELDYNFDIDDKRYGLHNPLE